jgi:hypothetical protein
MDTSYSSVTDCLSNILFLEALEFELKASHLLGRHSYHLR